MATSSCTNCFFSLVVNLQPYKNGGEYCSFLGKNNSNLQLLQSASSSRTRGFKLGSRKGGVVVRNATPEAAAAADLFSSFSIPSIPGFSDSPWITVMAGMLVGGPFLIQRLLTLTKEVDMVAQTVEKIADAVENVAEEVDKAAEGIAESLPEGGLKKMVHAVEELAEETAKDAQKVEDLMDKVEELDDKLEEFLEKQAKGSKKA